MKIILFFNRSTSDMTSTLTKSLYRARLCTKSCISINSCENGDTVLIVFNEALSRFVIAQVSYHSTHSCFSSYSFFFHLNNGIVFFSFRIRRSLISWKKTVTPTSIFRCQPEARRNSKPFKNRYSILVL